MIWAGIGQGLVSSKNYFLEAKNYRKSYQKHGRPLSHSPSPYHCHRPFHLLLIVYYDKRKGTLSEEGKDVEVTVSRQNGVARLHQVKDLSNPLNLLTPQRR